MSRTCPYCQQVSASRTLHKLHLKEMHEELLRNNLLTAADNAITDLGETVAIHLDTFTSIKVTRNFALVWGKRPDGLALRIRMPVSVMNDIIQHYAHQAAGVALPVLTTIQETPEEEENSNVSTGLPSIQDILDDIASSEVSEASEMSGLP